jgi:hypothetical protein
MREMFNNFLITRTLFSAILFILLFHHNPFAAEKGLGVGIILGEPTGISFKKWVGPKNAFDGAIAWSFGDEDALHLHADYLFHVPRAIRIDRSAIPLYYGIGVRLKFQDENRFGVRFPLGINLYIAEAPIDLFFEIVPIFNLAPKTDLDLNAAIGIRYYFH